MKKSSDFTPIFDCLNSSTKLEQLFKQAHEYSCIEQDCRLVMPTYFEQCHVVRFAEGSLVITCTNQTFASRIRQQLPMLKQALNRKGWGVSDIRLKVRFGFFQSHDQKKPINRRLPQSAVDSFQQLYDKISQNKSSILLAQTIARMLANSKK